MAAAPATRRQEAKANLFDVLRHHVKERSLGKLFDAPTDCILAEATSVQPAIVFIDTGRIPIISEGGIEGIPSLVVEMLSPSFAQLDCGPKAQLEGNEPEAPLPFLDLSLDPAAIWAWAVASRGDTLGLEGMGAMAIRTGLTYEDYAALPADGRRYEIHEGALSVTPAPGTRHQEVKANLFDVLRHHVKERSLGKLFDAPTDCILAEATIVQPDIVFVDTGRITIISERGIEGIPSLVVEVLSPSSAQLDRGPKAQLYARHLVPSYWIVDPGGRTIDTYALVEGTYRLAARLEGNESEALPPFLDLPLDPVAIWV